MAKCSFRTLAPRLVVNEIGKGEACKLAIDNRKGYFCDAADAKTFTKLPLKKEPNLKSSPGVLLLLRTTAMQEHWQTLTALFRQSLDSENPALFYPHARLLNALALQLQHHPDIGKETLSSFFQEILKQLTELFLAISQLSDDEKTRLDFSNFLYQLHESWELKRVQDDDLNLGQGYRYNLSDPWEITHDIGDLFGPASNKGYEYGATLQREITSGKTNYTDLERVSSLLKFALPVFNRRLSLIADKSADFSDKTFKQLTDHLNSLINWRIGQEPLQGIERKNILRYAQATLFYQSKLLKPFSNLATALEDFKAIERYPAGLLKIQRTVVWLERVNKDFPKKCILDKDDLKGLLAIWLEKPLCELPPSYKSLKTSLLEKRAVFEQKNLSPFKQQQQYSVFTKGLIHAMLDNSIALLGTPPCQVGLMLLGSSSREDRLPYSDIELALLYEPLVLGQKGETDHYIASLIALIELQLIHLGESPPNQGVWLDDSTSFRCYAYLRGSPEEVFKKGILDKQQDTQEWKYYPKEKNPRGLTLHTFLSDPSLYSLLQPLLVNEHYGGQHLFESYQKKVAVYLDDKPDGTLLADLYNLIDPHIQQKLSQTMTNRQMIGLWVWWDILRCLGDHLGTLNENKVDLKKIYHKPLAYFLLGLRLFYNLPTTNLEDTLQQLGMQKYLSPLPLANFLMNALEWVIALRIKNHREAKAQMEMLSLSTLTPEEQWHLHYFPALFRIMQGGIEYWFTHEAPEVFDLHKAIKGYFEHTLTHLKTGDAFAQWFIDVTGYLLYTQDYLDAHRYYYRLIPESYRQVSLKAAECFFSPLKQCPNVRFWRNENETHFWQQLFEAPLPNGQRPFHQRQQDKWRKTLSTLWVPEEAVEKEPLKIYITSLIEKKGGNFEHHLDKKVALHPEVTQFLLKEKWINQKGEFAQKASHNIAKTIKGNHLVIPYPNSTEPDFFFKVYPEYPLVELFLNDLAKRLGYFAPREVDLWFWQSGRYDYPVLVSRAVKGPTLSQRLKVKPGINFNPQAFSQSVLVSLLSSLEDNNPDNLIVLREEGQERLSCIDGDRCFVPTFKNQKLHAKDIVFCFDEIQEPIDKVVRQDTLCLNPQQVLNAWVDETQRLGDAVIRVFGGKVSDYYREWRADAEKSLLLPLLKFHAVNDLFQHLQSLQALFDKAAHDNLSITHADMVAKINPRLAHHYQPVFQHYKTPFDRFSHVAGYAYQGGKTLIDFETQKEDMWAGLPEAESIEATWKRDIENAKSQVQGLSESEGNLQSADVELKEGTLNRFKQLPQRVQEKLLQQLDFSLLKFQVQEELLRYVSSQGHWQNLVILQSSEINDLLLNLLLEKSPGLKSFKLSHLPQISGSFLNTLTKTNDVLTTLKLHHLPKLYYIGWSRGYLTVFRPLLPQLEKLEIRHCQNLLEINIEADLLKSLEIIGTPKLEVLQIKDEGLIYRHLEDYGKVEEKRFEEAKGYHDRGLAKINLGQYSDAVEDYDEAIRLDPKFAVAYTNRGFAKNSLGQYAAAIEDYDEAIRLDPKDAVAYCHRGSAKDSLGEYTAAIEDYDEAIRLDPKDAVTYSDRGHAKNNLGQYAAAMEDCDEAIRLDPQFAVAYTNRGFAKKSLGQYAAAIEDYDEAIRLDPKDAVTYTSRGLVKNRLGQHTAAIEDYNEAIRLDPKVAVTYSYRGLVKNRLGQHTAAIEDYDEAIRLDPKDAVTYSDRGLRKIV